MSRRLLASCGICWSLALLLAVAPGHAQDAGSTASFQQGVHPSESYRHVLVEIRSETPDKPRFDPLMRVGASSAKGVGEMRTVLGFPLTGIPADATIEQVRLVLTFENTIGKVSEIALHELLADTRLISRFVTWLGQDDETNWNTPGGDFAPEPLATITHFPAKNGAKVVFESSPAFIDVVEKSARENRLLNLILLASGAQSKRGYARFHSDRAENAEMRPRLEVTWSSPASEMKQSATQTKSAGTILMIQAKDFQFHGDWRIFGDRDEGDILTATQANSDAITVIDLPQEASYHIWTFSKDYADRQGARRYRLIVDGQPVPEESGDHGVLGPDPRWGWEWEKVDERNLGAGEHVIALHDTSNWYPRCAAILLTSEDFDPNEIDKEGLKSCAVLPKEVETNTLPTGFPEDPEPITGPVQRRELARLAGDRVRFRFYEVTGPNAKRIVRATEVKWDENWQELPLRMEEEDLFLLQSAEAPVTVANFYPSWPKSTVSRVAFETRGEKYEVPLDVRNPFYAAPAQELRAVDARNLGPDRVEVHYVTDSGTESTGTWRMAPENQHARLSLEFVPEKDGYASLGFAPFQSWTKDEAQYVLLPPMHQYQRVPDSPLMITSTVTPHPLALVQVRPEGVPGLLCLGVAADPTRIPFEWPSPFNAKYGFSILNGEGQVQPSVFYPILGLEDSRTTAGQPFEVSVNLFVTPGDWKESLEYSSTRITETKDYRKPWNASLTEATLNILDLLRNTEVAGWNSRYKGFYYVEGPDKVGHSSPLTMMSVVRLTGDENFYETRALPTIEYTLTRAESAFNWSGDKLRHPKDAEVQVPSAEWGVLYWQGLYDLTSRANPWMRDIAFKRLEMTRQGESLGWGRPAWAAWMGAWKLDGKDATFRELEERCREFIDQEVFGEKTRYLEIRPHYNVMFYPAWWQLPDMYELTRDPLYLRAAEEGGFYTIAGMWSQPLIPQGDITIHPGGEYGSYEDYTSMRWRGPEKFRIGYPRKPGDSPEHQVPAWQVSQVGRGFEQPTTYFSPEGFKNTSIVQQAAHLMRLYRHTKREIFRTYARNNIIGRFANYPGYYISGFTDLYMQKDYPYVGPDITGLYCTHISVHLAATIDFLVADAETRSDGKINFPYVVQRGYAQFDNRIYGSAPGRLYDDEGASLLLDRKPLTIPDIRVDYLTARSKDRFWVVLMNQVHEDIQVPIEFGSIRDDLESGKPARVYRGTETAGEMTWGEGKVEVEVPADGLVALSFPANAWQAFPTIAPLRDGHFQTDVDETWGELHAFRIRSPFGKDSLYVILTGKPERAKIRVSLEGKDAPVVCVDFPYEATIYPWPMDQDMKGTVILSLDGEEQEFSFSLKGTR